MKKQGQQKIWFISRHPGAWKWFCATGNRGRWQVTHPVSHIDPVDISTGDIVIGTLPIQLAAEICDKGAEYWHLTLALGENQRGKELSYDDMIAASASVEQYHIRRLSP